jgi:YVTN family beta-propeller protein
LRLPVPPAHELQDSSGRFVDMESFAKIDKNRETGVSGILAIIFVVAASVGCGGGTSSNGVGVHSARAYVANMASNDVPVIDTTTNAVVATVTVGDGPSDLALTPDGVRAYVVNTGGPKSFNGDTVSVIVTATNTVIDTIAVGILPSGLALSADGSRAYVTSGDGVSVVDTATETVLTTVVVGSGPVAVALTPVSCQKIQSPKWHRKFFAIRSITSDYSHFPIHGSVPVEGFLGE